MNPARAAVVAGSTSGIGLAIARRLCRDGFHVAVTGRDAKRGETVAAGHQMPLRPPVADRFLFCAIPRGLAQISRSGTAPVPSAEDPVAAPDPEITCRKYGDRVNPRLIPLDTPSLHPLEMMTASRTPQIPAVPPEGIPMSENSKGRRSRSLLEAAGLVAIYLTRRVLQLGWKRVTGKEAPAGPDDREVRSVRP